MFPTVYACNTARAIKYELKTRGFEHAVHGYEAEPAYLDFSSLAYRLGVIHQRWAPQFVRPTIFAWGVLNEPKSSSPPSEEK